MNRKVKLFCWAMSISFLGSLPLGTLNLIVANYIFRDDFKGAIGFSVSAIAVEMILVRIALITVKSLEKIKRYYPLFSLLTVIVLLILAFNAFFAAIDMQKFDMSTPLITTSPILAGLLLSIANPLHLPFWIGWTTVLKSKDILDQQPSSYNIFVIAIGAGTTLAFMLYSTAGHYLIDLADQRQVLLNWILGTAFAITAILQLYKTLSASLTKHEKRTI